MVAEKRRQSDRDTAVMMIKLDYIIAEVADIKKNIKECYVTKIEFDPVKKVVFGLVALILTGVIGAVITLVVRT
jgi:hypothetical protein